MNWMRQDRFVRGKFSKQNNFIFGLNIETLTRSNLSCLIQFILSILSKKKL